jgi:hypothetical protein
VAELAVREGDTKAAELVKAAAADAETAHAVLGPFYLQVIVKTAAAAAVVQPYEFNGLNAAHIHNPTGVC